MYDMTSKSALAHVLNQFSVPMFAVERPHTSAPFRFISLNEEMENAVGCDRHDILGKALDETLEQTESNTVLQRMTHCLETKGVVRFRGPLTFLKKQAVWDTTLQTVEMMDKRDRIVATSIQRTEHRTPSHQTPAFDDIQYFSSMADFQLQNLISLFETYQAEDLFETEAEQRVAKLSGMCRTVQRAVTDIKKSVRDAYLRNQELAGEQPLRVEASSIDRCGTLKALTEFSGEPNRWSKH